MHRQFKKLLLDAHGVSEFVIALNVDIRGFSTFSMKVDSSETAIYVKRVYAEVLDRYFADATFFKPTGDGLLIIMNFDEASLTDVANRVVAQSLKLVSEMGNLTDGDSMINFEVPQKVGIGIARGAACRLVSGRYTLDYSGRVLNLASRLMSLARPSGIVIDSGFGLSLLGDELATAFSDETVFLPGVAEEEPLTVHYTTEETTIPAAAKRPLVPEDWGSHDFDYTLKDLKTLAYRPTADLPLAPSEPGKIVVKVMASNPKTGGALIWPYSDFVYRVDAGTPQVVIDAEKVPGILTGWGIRRNDSPVTLRVYYPKN